MKEKNPVTVVNDLVEICKDAEKGFHDAATDVRDASLRELFLSQSRQMGQFGKTLQEQVTKMGGTPHTGGTVAGTLHRTWMDLRAALNLHNAKLVIQECERGEAAILNHYDHALKSTLPPEVKEIVEKQFVEITMQRNHLRDLEHPGEKVEKKTYSPLSIEK